MRNTAEVYSFDTDKANETLSKIGIDIRGENGYIYWTSTMESNGWAEVVGCGEIIEDPMPYTHNEISECTMCFVGRLDIKELKIEDLAFKKLIIIKGRLVRMKYKGLQVFHFHML